MSATDRPSSRLPELAAALASVLALVAIFLPWYATDPAIAASNIDGVRGELSFWTVHEAMRYVLLVLVVLMSAATVVALVRPRDGQGLHEPIMVLAVNAAGIVLYFGFLYRPGDPMQTISLRYGWFLALAGTLTPLITNAARAKARQRRSGSPVAARA